MKLNRFKQLLEAQMGNVKPLINEQMSAENIPTIKDWDIKGVKFMNFPGGNGDGSILVIKDRNSDKEITLSHKVNNPTYPRWGFQGCSNLTDSSTTIGADKITQGRMYDENLANQKFVMGKCHAQVELSKGNVFTCTNQGCVEGYRDIQK